MIQATAVTGLSTVLNTLLLFGRNKILAVMLGPFGIGIVSQINNFLLFLSTLASLGINAGVTKLVSENHSKGDLKEEHRVVLNGLKITMIATFLLVLAGLCFSSAISRHILSDPGYGPLIILCLVGFPFLVLFNFYRSVFRGLMEIRRYVSIGVVNSLAALILVVPLVRGFRLSGAVANLTLSYLVCWLVIQFQQKQRSQFLLEIKTIRYPADGRVTGDLVRYGFSSLVAGSSTLLALLFVRSTIISRLGIEDAGYFQAIYAISSQTILIIIESIGTYAFPHLSGIQNPEDFKKELNAVFRLTVILVTPLVLAVVVFRNLFVLLLYSSAFLTIGAVLPFQLAGDFFKSVGWSLGVALLPMKKLKAFVAIDVMVSLLFLIFARLLIESHGIRGVSIAYLISFISHVLFNYFYLRKTLDFRLAARNRWTLAGSMLILAFSMFLGRKTMLILSLPMLLAWAVLSLDSREKAFLMRKIGWMKSS
ncbi:oligosaccharide flippase family protein [bacterium]|nr:oligosaccharide flippase family protein [bacterium]